MIEKEIDLFNEFMLNRKYLRAISMFYSAYNLSIAILGIKLDESEIRRRNRIWAKWLIHYEKIDEKKFKIIHKFIQEDMNLIIQALNFIDKQNEQMAYEIGDIYKPFCIGILSYELEG